MTEYTSKSIRINREAYMYLRREMRKQRGCKPLTEAQEDRQWRQVTAFSPDGLAQADDDSFGGGDGTYNGRWWSWSVDTLKKMLDEAGLHYQDGEDVKFIPISL